MSIAEEVKQWTMPQIKPGAKVLWFENGRRGDRTWAATVVQCGWNTVMLNIAHEHGTTRRDSVRFVDDPGMTDDNRIEGAWDFAPDDNLLAKLAEEVEAIKRDMTGLKASVAKFAKGS